MSLWFYIKGIYGFEMRMFEPVPCTFCLLTSGDEPTNTKIQTETV
jgi:hypothetical protein